MNIYLKGHNMIEIPSQMMMWFSFIEYIKQLSASDSQKDGTKQK